MKIQSKFMTGLVSRIVKKVLRTKLGCEVDIQLNEFRTTVIDDMKNICTLCIEKEELAHKEARERVHYSPFQYPF